MIELSQKRILVTGGARGMGASHVEFLSGLGAKVIFGDLLDGEGSALASYLQAKGRDVHYVHLDVTNELDWVEAVSKSKEIFGGLDCLINNAGVTGVPGGIEIEDLQTWNQTISVNQTGCFLGMKTVIPEMRKSGGGSIVNISSILGFIGDGDYFSYTATKGAIRLMSKSAALKFASERIRINSICPGMVRTPMNDAEIDADEYVSNTPMGRMAEPIEVSKAIAFLLSDDSSFITGSDLVIDGGYLAR